MIHVRDEDAPAPFVKLKTLDPGRPFHIVIPPTIYLADAVCVPVPYPESRGHEDSVFCAVLAQGRGAAMFHWLNRDLLVAPVNLAISFTRSREEDE